jgi:hypothetical protein
MVHSWSNNCYLGFQSAVLVAIRVAQFQGVTKRWCTVTAEVASSSLVVPAIPNQVLTPVEEFPRGHKKVQIPREPSMPGTAPL